MTPVKLSPHDPQPAAARAVRLGASEVAAPPADAARRHRSSRVLALMAALALAAGPLAGCSDSGSVSGSSSGGASASATASALGAETGASASASVTATLSAEDVALRDAALAYPAPERPGDMDTNDVQGAAATANYFVNVYRYAFVTGDVSGVAAMSDPACTFCSSTIEDATTIHDAGGWVDPWDQEVLRLDYYDPVPGNIHSRVDVVATLGQMTRHDVDGSTGVTPPDPEETLTIVMFYSGDHWVIREAEVLHE